MTRGLTASPDQAADAGTMRVDQVDPTATAWLAPIRSGSPDAPTLIAVPYLGGGAALFNPWRASTAAPEMAVAAVRLPGRERRVREPPIRSFPELLDRMSIELIPALPAGPLAFFGYCAGGIVAYELARMAEEARHTTVPLFVWDCDAPQTFSMGERVSELPTDAFRLVLSRLGGMDPAVLASDELMKYLEPILRADLALFESVVYVHRSPLSGPIWVGGVRGTGGVSCTSLLGWHKRTGGPFTLRLWSGDHFMDAETMRVLLELIATEVQDLQ